MEKIKLGQSDLEVTPVGLGCWQFSKGKGIVGNFWPELDDEEIEKIIKVSLDKGVNWFDTAEIYGNGESEKNTAKFLKKAGIKNGEAVIATKWWPLLRTSENIKETIDERLEALEGFEIDLYQVHQPYSFSSAQKEMDAMFDLVSEKKIKYIGVSNFGLEKMKSAHERLKSKGSFLCSNQVKYNLLDRRIEKNGVLHYALKNKIAIIAYSPLEQGLLTGKFHDDPDLIKSRSPMRRLNPKFSKKNMEKTRPVVDLVRNIAKKYEVTSSQVALNWLINYHKGDVVVIPGATKAKHAEGNAASLDFSLTENEMKELDKVSRVFKG